MTKRANQVADRSTKDKRILDKVGNIHSQKSTTSIAYERTKKWRAKGSNHQKYLLYLRLWRSNPNNKERMKLYKRRYYQKNREKLIADATERNRLKRLRLKVLKEINEIVSDINHNNNNNKRSQSSSLEHKTMEASVQ